jgi:hypothetical protein
MVYPACSRLIQNAASLLLDHRNKHNVVIVKNKKLIASRFPIFLGTQEKVPLLVTSLPDVMKKLLRRSYCISLTPPLISDCMGPFAASS